MEKFDAFLSAVDIVCGDCHYCDEARYQYLLSCYEKENKKS